MAVSFKFHGGTKAWATKVKAFLVASTRFCSDYQSSLFVQYPEGGVGTRLVLKQKRRNCMMLTVSLLPTSDTETKSLFEITVTLEQVQFSS